MFKSLILLAFSASAMVLAADPEGCLLAVVQPSQEINPAGKPQTVTVTNNCGKDITAYFLRCRDRSGGKLSGLAEDHLVMLARPAYLGPYHDILRTGKTWSIVGAVDATVSTVSVSAVWYADMTTAGDPEEASYLVEIRKQALLGFKDELEALGSYDTYVLAKELPQDAAAAKAENRRGYRYLTYLAESFSRSDAVSWNDFVQLERRRLGDEIKLLETHLAAQGASGQQKTEVQ